MTQSKVALVTGANKGIGKEVARQLGELGVTVWLGCRDEGRGKAAEAELRAEGLDARLVQLDVTDPTTIHEAKCRIEEEHGRLDILVNNAGIVAADGRRPPSATPVEAMRQVFDINVFGVVAVTNAMLPLLRLSASGRIVNVSSPLGSLTIAAGPASPAASSQSQLLDYSSSKAALNMVTLLYARELLGTPIKVNAVNPGYCATALNNFQGVLSPATGASAVVSAATLPDDGPTGAFVSVEGPVPW